MVSVLKNAVFSVGASFATQAVGAHVTYHARNYVYQTGVRTCGQAASAFVGNASYIGPAMNWVGRGVGHIIMPSVVESSFMVGILSTASSVATFAVPVLVSCALSYAFPDSDKSSLDSENVNANEGETAKQAVPSDLDVKYTHNDVEIDDIGFVKLNREMPDIKNPEVSLFRESNEPVIADKI